MPDQDIIVQMDAFASELLLKAKDADGLQDRLAVFVGVGKWIAIKNRIADPDDEEGHKLNDLKSRLKSDAPRTARSRPNRVAVVEPEPEDPDTGTGLDALRAKLPRTRDGADNRRFRRLGDDPGSPPFTAAGGNRRLPVDVSGGADAKPDVDAGGD